MDKVGTNHDRLRCCVHDVCFIDVGMMDYERFLQFGPVTLSRNNNGRIFSRKTDKLMDQKDFISFWSDDEFWVIQSREDKDALGQATVNSMGQTSSYYFLKKS